MLWSALGDEGGASSLPEQGKYWRCLRGLSEQSAFNPFQTPYARLAAGHARRASLDADLSPRQPAKKLRPAPPGDAPHHRPGASPPQHAACSDAPVRARGAAPCASLEGFSDSGICKGKGA